MPLINSHDHINIVGVPIISHPHQGIGATGFSLGIAVIAFGSNFAINTKPNNDNHTIQNIMLLDLSIFSRF